MPDAATTTLDDLRADADAAYDRWRVERNLERRRDLRLEYYRAAQAVLVAERQARQPLPDTYRSVAEVQP